MQLRSFATLALLVASVVAHAQMTWMGNTRTLLGSSAMPSKGAYVQPNQAITITTQTFPISQGQSVRAVYTTDNWATTREVQFNFDFNVGNNSQWFTILGPFPQGTNVEFYLRGNHTGGDVRFDNNGGQNYGYTWRYSPAIRRGAILQWFATDYVTMMKRLPEVVMAGYGSIYLPPPSKAGGGGFSTGFNPMDRFDLGDRFQVGTVKTRYGTTEELVQLVNLAKRYGLEVYCDLVTNHNDNRASWQPNRYPDLIPEDFHIRSSADTGNNEINFNNAGPLSFEMLNHELVGLIDIAHENGNQTQTGPFTLPAYAQMNMWGKPWFVRHPLNPQYYPGGAPYREDVREYLKRWCWWLSTVIGFDGFRIDAVKHTNPAFFMTTQGQAGYATNNGDLLPYLYSFNPKLNIFGEVLTQNSWELREYAKTGMHVLDFPLKYRMDSLFNSQGFGDIGATLGNLGGIDSSTGLGFAHGGLDPNVSVAFVQSHDDGPPQSNNLAHAFVLTRPGNAKVYYDGNNQIPNDYSQFPRPGREDALGNLTDGTIRMVDARNRFARGGIFNRWVSQNVYAYERQTDGQATLLVGLNNRGDLTSQTITVDSAFPAGTVLEDLTGQQPNVTVGANNRVTITIPSNSSANNSNNARGYVMYAPVTAKADGSGDAIRVTDSVSGGVYAPVTITSPNGRYAAATNWRAATVTGNRINIELSTTAIGNTAFLQLDSGFNTGAYTPLTGTREGLTDGFVAMAKSANGRFSTANLNLAGLVDGLHMIRTRVFNNTGNGAPLFQDFYYWFYLQRGLGTGWTIDGNLQEFGPTANWWQQRSASSNNNRMDGLFVTNDEQYLYVGVAGRVDASEGLTNGMTVLLDTTNGVNGVRDLSSIHDDSGPAPRLISNTRINLPSGFAARYAISSFRGRGISSAPEANFSGGPATPPVVGAQAGVFGIDPNSPAVLSRIPSVVAYQPRGSISAPLTGLEVAIPLRSLYQGVMTANSPLNLISYLGSTGESGQTLLSTDASRATLGGRPAATSWVSNQFLPTQSSVTSDPGTNAVNLTSALNYRFRMAETNPNIAIQVGPVASRGRDQLQQELTITNTGSTTITGPIWVVVNMGRDTTEVLNASGRSLLSNFNYYINVAPTLAPGQAVPVTVRFGMNEFRMVRAQYSARVGRGLL